MQINCGNLCPRKIDKEESNLYEALEISSVEKSITSAGSFGYLGASPNIVIIIIMIQLTCHVFLFSLCLTSSPLISPPQKHPATNHQPSSLGN